MIYVYLDEAIQEGFIYLENLKFFVMKCFVWIEHLKCMHFFEVFQLAKLEEIQIP